ncbi:TorF family putative porin [Microbulbifer celer]|uniref:TorF family putative porin n=1 Tax=Microbulbifer celer TaxID=435905 RepID=A0ABW3U433_9GAMM|nr:TorF family putative porin [Microbulbifer celer]UFN58033.1 TorF family putative porin [Microbulbifer celer]
MEAYRRHRIISLQTLFFFLSVLGVACQVTAQEEEKSDGFGTFGGSLLIASDYMFRSISNSNLRPAVQGDFNWSHESGLYAGLWASNTDFGGVGNSMEIDPYVGFTRDIGESDFNFDIGYWSYNYPGSKSSLDYGEVYTYLNYSKGKFSASPSVWWTHNYFGKDFLDGVSALAYEVTFGYEVCPGLTPSLRVGEQTFGSGYDNLEFTYWDIGVDYTIDDWNLGLRWYDTDGIDPFLANPNLADGEVVFGVTRSF